MMADSSEKCGKLIIISGPSGVGKSTICNRVVKLLDAFLSVSATTRAKGAAEVDGVNYCFFDQTNFELSETEEWNPQLEAEETIDGFRFAFNPTNEIKNVIATRLHKEITDLTKNDYAEFVRNSIENSIKPS